MQRFGRSNNRTSIKRLIIVASFSGPPRVEDDTPETAVKRVAAIDPNRNPVDLYTRVQSMSDASSTRAVYLDVHA